jgi:hypothetical protein
VELARAGVERAAVQLAAGRTDAARKDAEAARDALAVLDPAVVADLKRARLTQAEVKRAGRLFADALAEVEATLQPAPTTAPAGDRLRARALALAGELLHDLGRDREARQRLFEAKVTAGPAVDRELLYRADGHVLNGRIRAAEARLHADREDWRAARSLAEEAVREFEECLKRTPEYVAAHRELSRARALHCEATANDGATDAAANLIAAHAVEAKRRLRDHPEGAARRAAAAEAMTAYAVVALAKRLPGPAGDALQEAEALVAKLAADVPGRAALFARVAYVRALEAKAAGQPAAAREAADEARRRLAAAVGKPFDPDVRRLTWEVGFLRADLLFADGKEAEGVAALKPLLEEPFTEKRAYQAAARLNAVLVRADKDSKLPADRRDQLAKDAAADAVAFLRLAIRRGGRWSDSDFPRLPPLRDRPEFRAAEAELRGQ